MRNCVVRRIWPPRISGAASSTIDGKARLLGEFTVLHGNHRLLFSAPERYERVTRGEVLEVARAVFAVERRTVGLLRPLPEAA